MVSASPIDIALKLLHEGEVVGIPTETVYGLAGDATNQIAIDKIYKIKNRPRNNPLIIHVSSIEMASEYVKFDERSLKIAKILWENEKRSITFVLKKLGKAIDYATNYMDTVAIRIPQHYLAKELITKFKRPLAAPSANLSTRLSPTDCSHVTLPCFVIEGGNCNIGLESTILDLTKEIPLILRPGECTKDDIEGLTGVFVDYISKSESVVAPGHFGKHYSPSLPIRINVTDPKDNEAYLCLGKPIAINHFSLSESYDLKEVARNLFNMMRVVDNGNYASIAVSPIEEKGIGIAINDRLRRASIE